MKISEPQYDQDDIIVIRKTGQFTYKADLQYKKDDGTTGHRTLKNFMGSPHLTKEQADSIALKYGRMGYQINWY